MLAQQMAPDRKMHNPTILNEKGLGFDRPQTR